MPAAHPSRSWRPLARDGGWVLAALALCPLVAQLSPARPDGPLRRARELRALEQELGLWVEPHLHAWAGGVPGLLAVMGAFYFAVHFPATIGALVWTRLTAPGRFGRARNAFVLTQALVVAGYVLLPAAPPWMLERPDEIRGSTSSLVYVLQSPFAAFPSGHVAFACLTAAVVLPAVRARWLRLAVLAYPPVVTSVVLATANHFWLDAAAGAACAALALAVSALPWRRPRTRGRLVPGPSAAR